MKLSSIEMCQTFLSEQSVTAVKLTGIQLEKHSTQSVGDITHLPSSHCWKENNMLAPPGENEYEYLHDIPMTVTLLNVG